jgi:hypothetical protein
MSRVVYEPEMQESGSALRRAVAAALAAVLLVLAGCAGASSYGRAGPNGEEYTVRQLSADHYQVTVTGAANVELAVVEGQVRRRAAEVTLKAGYSHFVLYTNSAAAEINSSPSADFWNAENGYLSGNVRHGFATGVGGLSPYLGAGAADLNTRYTASSEIIVLKGDAATGNPDALSASEILDRGAAARGS